MMVITNLVGSGFSSLHTNGNHRIGCLQNACLLFLTVATVVCMISNLFLFVYLVKMSYSILQKLVSFISSLRDCSLIMGWGVASSHEWESKDFGPARRDQKQFDPPYRNKCSQFNFIFYTWYSYFLVHMPKH